LSGVDELEILRRALKHHIATKGGLEHFELVQRQARNAAVGGVVDFALRAVGGADDADRITAVELKLESGGAWAGSAGSIIPKLFRLCNKNLNMYDYK